MTYVGARQHGGEAEERREMTGAREHGEVYIWSRVICRSACLICSESEPLIMQMDSHFSVLLYIY